MFLSSKGKQHGVKVRFASLALNFNVHCWPIPHQRLVSFGVMNPWFSGHDATLLFLLRIVVCCVDRLNPQAVNCYRIRANFSNTNKRFRPIVTLRANENGDPKAAVIIRILRCEVTRNRSQR